MNKNKNKNKVKSLLLVVCSVLAIAVLVYTNNLYLDDFSAAAVGGTPTSVLSVADGVSQGAATTVSTTVKRTAQELTTAAKPTAQELTTAAPPTTQAPVEITAATETTTVVVPENVNYGTDGRLYVPRVGISVALYYYDITEENFEVAQAVTDRRDSATCGYSYGIYVISDHRTQEFGRLLDVECGDTAHIDYPDGTQVNMVCVSCFDGYNAGYDLLCLDGSSAVEGAPCDVIMRTCLNSNGGLRITYWCYC